MVEPGLEGAVAEAGMVVEGGVGAGKKKVEDWGCGEGVDGTVPDGQGPSNVFVNY